MVSDDKCLNCDSDDIRVITHATSGCSDAPKGKNFVEFRYWCNNCNGLYFFGFMSKDRLSMEMFTR